MEDRPLMKRKSRSLAGKQQEACGVWLDTSALKRRKLQSFLGKPVLKVLSQPSSYSAPSKVSFLRTKQTTISTFFRPQQAGDGKTRSKSLLPVATNGSSNMKSPHLPAGGEDPLPASVIHPVVMERCGQQLVKKPQPYLPGNCHPVQAQLYNSCILRSTKDDNPAGEKEYPFSFDLAQRWEEKRVLDYAPVFEPPLRERNGDWERDPPLSLLRESPKRKVASSQRTKFQRRYRDPSSDSENINPQLEKGMNQGKPLEGLRETAPRLLLQASGHFCSSENSQVDVASSLFTQDSEGYKVISHCLPDRGKLHLQNKPLWGKNSSAVSPSHKGHSEACYSTAGGPRTSPGTTRSVLADTSEKSCYDLLFTEDSEGNKVIKH
ncbi:aurora kinase A- and ninein-interacting protein [Pogona vitticeps]